MILRIKKINQLTQETVDFNFNFVFITKHKF